MSSQVLPHPSDPGYPVEWEGDVVLRDGSIGHVRPITPADADAIHRFHDAQSAESIYLRFFAPIKHLSDRDVHRFTHVDHTTRVALVVVVGDDIVGIGRFDTLDDPKVAEVAFNISDHYQGKGVGSVLLEHLAAIAQEQGVTRFVADVLPQNRKMMKVFTDAGYEVAHHFDDGVIAVEFTIEPTARSQAVQLAREHRSEAQSVRGLPTHRTVAEIGEPVDMAVVAVPAERVLDVVDDCAAAGVKTLLVLSSGFAETGELGAARQAELLVRARRGGMRVVGPNSYGLLNNDPAVRLNATIARSQPVPGTLGVFSQSGGLGVGLLTGAARAGLGLSIFASAGNRVDVSGNDVMQYLIDDDSTTTVALYLESIGNARKFSRIARQLSLRKPVVAVKSPTAGAVPPGHRARASRIGPEAFDALLAQAGVIGTQSVRELIHISMLLDYQPLPQGEGIVVVGTSPGLNAITAQAAQQAGLRVVGEPMTLPTQASPRLMAEAFEAAFALPEADMLSITLTAPLTTSEEEIASAIAHISGTFDKPCVTSFVGTRDVSDVMRRAGRLLDPETGRRRVVPVYETPLDGVAALSAASRYARWRRSDHGERVRPCGLNRGVADRIVREALAADPQGGRLDTAAATELLAAYGIDVRPMVPVATAEEAIAAAASLGYPVVVRSLIESVRFRPGAGGESGEETTPDGVAEAFDSMSRRLAAFGDPQLVVQATVPSGIATIVSSTEDPLFGPVVSFGLAGPVGKLLGDTAHRIPPLTDVDVRALVSDLRVSPLLEGYRGSVPVDIAALEDVVARVAALADDIPEISHLVLDYVNARPEGVDVMGAQVDVAPAVARTDAGRRALT